MDGIRRGRARGAGTTGLPVEIMGMLFGRLEYESSKQNAFIVLDVREQQCSHIVVVVAVDVGSIVMLWSLLPYIVNGCEDRPFHWRQREARPLLWQTVKK